MNRSKILRSYFRSTFLVLILIPALALVIGRGSFGLSDPAAPHIATNNMVLAVMTAFALVCFKASYVQEMEHARILAELGSPFLILLGTIILLLNLISTASGIGFILSGLYFLLNGVLLCFLAWPNPAASLLRGVMSLPSYFASIPARIRNPEGSAVPCYFALFVAVLLTGIFGLLQPGIGLAFRWYPYENPAALNPKESLIMSFFVPATLILYRVFNCLYSPKNLLFTEFMIAMGFFHGFVMMVDSIAGTQGNNNVHHIAGGDIILMWAIGFLFLVYHPALDDSGIKLVSHNSDADVQ
jgi:hypothetical protein